VKKRTKTAVVITDNLYSFRDIDRDRERYYNRDSDRGLYRTRTEIGPGTGTEN
jgi:hypothetical protein